jgi:arylsulfatase A
MLGKAKSPRQEFLYYSARGKLNGIRQGDFKLRKVKNRKGKETIELYNLTKDISEKNNLAEDMPEKVEALTKSMLELDAEISKNKRPRGEM